MFGFCLVGYGAGALRCVGLEGRRYVGWGGMVMGTGGMVGGVW